MSDRQERSYDGEMMAKGREGENAVTKWLVSLGKTVTSVAANEFMQKQDVDILFSGDDGVCHFGEIKTDHNMSRTHNFCFEIMRFYHPSGIYREGWAIKSPADFLFVHTPDTGQIYCFVFDKLRDACVQYVRDKGKDIRSTMVETDKSKTTLSLLIPLSALFGTYTIA